MHEAQSSGQVVVVSAGASGSHIPFPHRNAGQSPGQIASGPIGGGSMVGSPVKPLVCIATFPTVQHMLSPHGEHSSQQLATSSLELQNPSPLQLGPGHTPGQLAHNLKRTVLGGTKSVPSG